MTLDVLAGDDGPTEQQRRLLEGLRAEYPAIRRALRDLVNGDADAGAAAEEAGTTRAELASRMRLCRIEILGAGEPYESVLYYRISGVESEHGLNAAVKDGLIVELRHE